jgi:hypothetical protein
MIYLAVLPTKSEALAMEKQLKGGQGRAWLREAVLSSMVELGFISA